jgi:hypothetical protein
VFRTLVAFSLCVLVGGRGVASAQTSQTDHKVAQTSQTDHKVFDRLEMTVFPGGVLIATEGSAANQPGFENFVPGGSVAYNFTPFIAVEGEVAGAIGVTQDLTSGGVLVGHLKTPSMLGYDANVRVNLLSPSNRFVPYAVGGIGGVRTFERQSLGLISADDFLTGNVGGGLKVMFGNWGVRGDYRFFALRSNGAAPDFIGPDVRYAHRVYGGVVYAPGHSAARQ